MTEEIYIDTKIEGLSGVAECFAAERTFYKKAPTQAAALSGICADLAKVPELNGATWIADKCNLKGVVGNQINKKRKRLNISEMATFELRGGMMHGDAQ